MSGESAEGECALALQREWHFGFVERDRWGDVGATIKLGPQAMEGDLKVDPGDTVKAGYDFTLPGNNKTYHVSFTNVQVVYTVHCASGATPS